MNIPRRLMTQVIAHVLFCSPAAKARTDQGIVQLYFNFELEYSVLIFQKVMNLMCFPVMKTLFN